jgi:hypothetical protein
MIYVYTVCDNGWEGTWSHKISRIKYILKEQLISADEVQQDPMIVPKTLCLMAKACGCGRSILCTI